MSTGNIRGQRTQSSTSGYKTLASSIASGNNGGSFKRIYINAFERYNGNSELALSSTLGIQKGDYAHTNNYSFTTFKSSSGPYLGDYKKNGVLNKLVPQTNFPQVNLGNTISSAQVTGNTYYISQFVKNQSYITTFNGAYCIQSFGDNTSPNILNITRGYMVVLGTNVPQNWTINVSGIEQNNDDGSPTIDSGYLGIQNGNSITNYGIININQYGEFTKSFINYDQVQPSGGIFTNSGSVINNGGTISGY